MVNACSVKLSAARAEGGVVAAKDEVMCGSQEKSSGAPFLDCLVNKRVMTVTLYSHLFPHF